MNLFPLVSECIQQKDYMTLHDLDTHEESIESY